MTVINFWLAKESDCFTERFGVKLTRNEEFELMSALHLQVSIISQALIFITRSRRCSVIECPGLLLLFAFFAAQLICYSNCCVHELEFLKSKRSQLGLRRCDFALQHHHIRPVRHLQIYHSLRLEWKGTGQYAQIKGLWTAREGSSMGPLTNGHCMVSK